MKIFDFLKGLGSGTAPASLEQALETAAARGLPVLLGISSPL